ncbi:D-2-hydroxyacid dehydrogenase [Pelagibacterium limicola]|uniref:D-2-hydroxyacid dehydrogenase n=1 Tax=Pelagibacterium limicola TaxID=2791022 RepID=UPI0018AFECC5|nr:D-2-hydroxyacid dehydrogenase [Pelagibacterium limicola]
MPHTECHLPPVGVREIKVVLATVPYEAEEIEQLRRAVASAEFIHCSSKDDQAIEQALKRADVAIIPEDIDDRYIAAPFLKWVHCDHSGLTRSARKEAFEKGMIVTGAAGRSASALAQHAFYFALALTFDAKKLIENQAAHIWRGIPGYEGRQGLPGKTLGVVGFGNTGAEMAALGRAFQMNVVVYTRSVVPAPSTVDVMLCAERGDSLDPLVEQADVIMLATKLTDATYHMFAAPQFARMKKSAFIINMSRGAVIDEEALVDALRSGEIAGAGLDVFTKEPLPTGSPLWDEENVIITPHMTPAQPDKRQRSMAMILDNIARYLAGEEMLNAITQKDVFTHELPPHPAG